jgi:hypothetical protein
MGRKRRQPRPAPLPASAPPPPAAVSPFWRRVRVLGGVWFLVAGVAMAALALTFTSWPGVGVFAYVAVLGALLLVEAWHSKPPAGVPAEPRPGWRMPITLHMLLGFLALIGGFFGGAMVGAITFIAVMRGYQAAIGPVAGEFPEAVRGVVSLLVAAPLFFGGAVFGLRTAQRLMNEHVPARCPRCGGPSYCRPGRPVTYHCAACRHAYETVVYER